MEKITIKPLRSFHHGDAVYTEDHPVKVDADEAAFFVRNGWAVEVQVQPKQPSKQKSKNGQDGGAQPKPPQPANEQNGNGQSEQQPSANEQNGNGQSEQQPSEDGQNGGNEQTDGE